jgi:hypothetical protein
MIATMPTPRQRQPDRIRQWVVRYWPGSDRIAYRVDPVDGTLELQMRGVRVFFNLTEDGMICATEGLDKRE